MFVCFMPPFRIVESASFILTHFCWFFYRQGPDAECKGCRCTGWLESERWSSNSRIRHERRPSTGSNWGSSTRCRTANRWKPGLGDTRRSSEAAYRCTTGENLHTHVHTNDTRACGSKYPQQRASAHSWAHTRSSCCSHIRTCTSASRDKQTRASRSWFSWQVLQKQTGPELVSKKLRQFPENMKTKSLKSWDAACWELVCSHCAGHTWV